ncbi:hypothetical protein [Bacillus changyiensis]|uniref:hypothetical protein n=1 Tax=Bacillus changyiensis TaxID=3004103 RepID=UPI0022DF48E4|nr:hypothetical protein [Bacillus changyiensis]MDA1478430.1 hypothetical protein [Bacillus changyiensis]
MKKNLLTLLLIAMVVNLFLPSTSFALSGNEPTYTYWMQSGKQKYVKKSFGKWQNKGSVFHGPGTMTKNYTTKTSFSIGPGVQIPYTKINLSVSLGSEKSISTTARRSIPKGKKGQFQIRNEYRYYKVKMVQWISIDGRRVKTGKEKTITVTKKAALESRITLKGKNK